MVVCLATSRMYALWRLGLRTADMAVSPVNTARMLLRWEFCTTKKKPGQKKVVVSQTTLVKERKQWGVASPTMRRMAGHTADDYSKEYSNDEIPDSHAYNDTDDGDVLGPKGIMLS